MIIRHYGKNVVGPTPDLDQYADWRKTPNPQVGDGWDNFALQWNKDIQLCRGSGIVAPTIVSDYSFGTTRAAIGGAALLDNGDIIFTVSNVAATKPLWYIYNHLTGAFEDGPPRLIPLQVVGHFPLLLKDGTVAVALQETNPSTGVGIVYPMAIIDPSKSGGIIKRINPLAGSGEDRLLPRCLTKDSKILAATGGSSIKVVDPDTGDVAACSVPALSIASSQLMPNGKIFCLPGSPTSAIGPYIYDTDTDTYIEVSGSWLPSNNRKVPWGSTVLMPDGRIFCVPADRTHPAIYDPINDVQTIPGGAAWPVAAESLGIRSFWGGVVMPDGRIFCVPGRLAYGKIYDPITDTTINTATLFEPQNTAAGSSYCPPVRMLDGRIYCAASMASVNKIVSVGLFSTDKNYATSPYNAFPA